MFIQLNSIRLEEEENDLRIIDVQKYMRERRIFKVQIILFLLFFLD